MISKTINLSLLLAFSFIVFSSFNLQLVAMEGSSLLWDKVVFKEMERAALMHLENRVLNKPQNIIVRVIRSNLPLISLATFFLGTLCSTTDSTGYRVGMAAIICGIPIYDRLGKIASDRVIRWFAPEEYKRRFQESLKAYFESRYFSNRS